MRAVIAVTAALGLCLATATARADFPPGWTRIDLTGTYGLVYVPSTVDTSGPVPIALFLHGAGGTPDVYQSFVARPADTAGLVLLMPKSVGMSWDPSMDITPINEILERADTELTVDLARTGIAGHSAGGAFSFLLAYSSEGINAVFTLAAPYYPVRMVSDPMWRAPIRMYYGTTDPNYTGGSYDMLQAQWMSLGVPFESDIQMGYGHNDWPESSMTAGFQFLVGNPYPIAAVDAGPTPAPDAGPPLPGTDAGPPLPGTDAGPIAMRDAGTTGGGGGGRGSSGGCDCATSSDARAAGTFVPILVALMLVVRRRRGA